MTFNIVRKADGKLAFQANSLAQAHDWIGESNLYIIEPDGDIHARPHPYRDTSYVGSPTWISWCRMLQRVRGTDPNSLHHSRGITVTPDWLTFSGFLADMGQRPEGKTLDRINNLEGYCKANCRWATPEQQQRNRSSVIQYTLDGYTAPLVQWATDFGLPRDLVYNRYNKQKHRTPEKLFAPKNEVPRK